MAARMGDVTRAMFLITASRALSTSPLSSWATPAGHLNHSIRTLEVLAPFSGYRTVAYAKLNLGNTTARVTENRADLTILPGTGLI